MRCAILLPQYYLEQPEATNNFRIFQDVSGIEASNEHKRLSRSTHTAYHPGPKYTAACTSMLGP